MIGHIVKLETVEVLGDTGGYIEATIQLFPPTSPRFPPIPEDEAARTPDEQKWFEAHRARCITYQLEHGEFANVHLGRVTISHHPVV